MKTFDVVIIGAGLAGLQCAKLLSRQGAKILLADRKSDLAKGIHTTGIFVRKTFEDFEFPAGSLGRAVKNVALYSPALRPMKLKSDFDEFRVGKMAMLYENFLEEAVGNGVNFARKTSYKGLEMLDGENIVTLEKNGEPYQVKCKVIIGADGANSRVARDLGLDENKEFIVGYEEVYQGIKLDGEPILHCFLDSKLAPGYLAWVTNDGDEVHVGVGGYAREFNPKEALGIFKEKIKGKFVDLESGELAESRGGKIPVGGILKRIACKNGVLIGDAAGAVSPLTAGGLDPCMRLSKFASEIISERLKSDDANILLQFSGELFRARFISRIWMRRIMAMMKSQALLEAACLLARLPLFRNFARHVFFGRGSFPEVKIRAKELKFESEING